MSCLMINEFIFCAGLIFNTMASINLFTLLYSLSYFFKDLNYFYKWIQTYMGLTQTYKFFLAKSYKL